MIFQKTGEITALYRNSWYLGASNSIVWKNAVDKSRIDSITY
jgi:hypothetical protein